MFPISLFSVVIQFPWLFSCIHLSLTEFEGRNVRLWPVVFFISQKATVFLLAEASFLFAFAVLTSRGKRAWVETHFDPTAVHDLGRGRSSNRMLHDRFADCDKNSLCLANYFTVIPLLLSEPTRHKVSREDWVAK